MTVRCDQCGHESDPRYRFCGMCGAKLPPPPPPEPVATRAAEPAPTASSEEPVRRVSGPSFLGLADEPTSSVTYLLEDDLSESHWGRTVVLLLVLLGIGFAGWHWRSNVREYVNSRLAQKPSNNQTEQANNPATAQSDSSSQTAGQSPTTISPVDNQNTAPAAAAPSTSATPAGSATPTAPQSAQNSAPNGSNSPAPGAPTNPSPSAPTAATPQAQNASAAPSETPADQGTRGGDTVASTDTETPAPAATSKRAKPKVQEPAEPDTSAADALEIQGERYLYGSGVPVSCDRAQRSLEAAADQGSAKADSVLGTMYATGHCVNRDSPLAYRWFARALQKDPSNARLERDLQVLWNQMSPDERQIAMRR